MSKKQKDLFDTISLNLALTQSKGTKTCTTPNCKNIFWMEEGLTIVTCDLCNVKRCLSCDVDFNMGHEGISCAKFQIKEKKKKATLNDMPISQQL